jgi:hypothetical protein
MMVHEDKNKKKEEIKILTMKILIENIFPNRKIFFD